MDEIIFYETRNSKKIDDQERKICRSNVLVLCSTALLKISKMSWKNTGERKLFERFEAAMIAMDNYSSLYHWSVHCFCFSLQERLVV